MLKPHLVLFMFLPSSIKRFILNLNPNNEIHPTAYIGMSYLDVKSLKLGADSKIMHFNVFKNIDAVNMGFNSKITNFNTFTAVSTKSNWCPSSPGRKTELTMGNWCGMTSHHYFDLNDAISIGNYSQIAGRGSTFYTHGINIHKNMQETKPITIGNYCMVASSCLLIKGSNLPDYSVLGGGSTLTKHYTETHSLYSGNPAMPQKTLSNEAGFFNREIGFVA